MMMFFGPVTDMLTFLINLFSFSNNGFHPSTFFKHLFNTNARTSLNVDYQPGGDTQGGI